MALTNKEKYARRIERNMAKGYSRSQARGHAEKTELSIKMIESGDKSPGRNWIMEKVIKSKNPELIAEYKTAYKERFKKPEKGGINSHLQNIIKTLQSKLPSDYDYARYGETPLA
jgi:hypothetical protein